MMESQGGEFLEDYRREADDLLQRTASILLELESLPAEGRRRGRLDEALRHLHTLKGLSGMVGLQTAVRVTHALETALRRIAHGDTVLDEPLLDLLLEGVRLLQAVSSGHVPDSEGASLTVERLEQQPGTAPSVQEPLPVPDMPLPEDMLEALKPEDWEALRQARDRGRALVLVIFRPSADLAAAGVNVNSVRARLSATGELLKAVPLVAGREIRFAFLLASRAAEPTVDLPGLEWSVLLSAGEQQPEPAEAHAPADQPPGAPSAVRLGGPSVRVDVSRLDEVMRLLGDLVVSRSRLDQGLRQMPSPPGPVLESSVRVERQLRELREAVMRTRMVPLSHVFGRMPLAVRDLARASGRKVQLVLRGEETQIDKVLVDQLLDPLLHLVRNAIAHGIEPGAARLAAGKPETGTLLLRGSREGDSILIHVNDDGGGIDAAAIAERARALGLLRRGQALAGERLLEMLCHPGLSTRSEAGLDAGRGLGMHIVRQAVDEMGGRLLLENEPGRGACFTIRLPLTLAVVDCFFVRLGTELYAVPRDTVQEVVEIEPSHVVRVGLRELYAWRGRSLPLVRLRTLLGCPEAPAPGTWHALLHGEEDRQVGYVVDRVESLRETVVRPMIDPLVSRPWVPAATELPQGGLAVILDLARLADHPRRHPATAEALA